MFASHAKASRELGFAPGPVDSALERAIAWFRASGAMPLAPGLAPAVRAS
jgi:hypothetical protein